MRNYVYESQDRIISPTAFIMNLQDHHIPALELECPFPPLDQPEEPSPKLWEENAKTSSREEKKRQAGLRSREKKKKYVQSLEENVKNLATEVEHYQIQISKCKDQLVEALRTTKQSTNNQHAHTYSELEHQATSEDPDLDRVNLLLDLIQSRIGANSKERQTKIDYNFKQIINSMFPAIHRYLMHAAAFSNGIFDPSLSPSELASCPGWTHQLYSALALNSEQLSHYRLHAEKFRLKRVESIRRIHRLKTIRDQIVRHQQKLQRSMWHLRQELTPVQSALITVFGQKNKLRRQFGLGEDLQRQDRVIQLTKECGGGPRKRVKLVQ